MAYKIFFSHSGRDAEWVISIQKELQGRQYNFYLFEDNPQVTGLTIDEEVHAKIKERDLTLVFLSKHSQEPQSLSWITKEIAWSEGMGKPLVFIIDRETPYEVTGLLRGRKYISFDKLTKIAPEFYTILRNSLYAALGQKRLTTIVTWAIAALGFGLYVITYRKQQH